MVLRWKAALGSEFMSETVPMGIGLLAGIGASVVAATVSAVTGAGKQTTQPMSAFSSHSR
jgi:hypothetical protein